MVPHGIPGETTGAVFLLAVLCIAGLLGAGCISGFPGVPASARPEPAGTLPGGPSVLITSPEFDGGILSGNVTVVFMVKDFTMAPPGPGKNIAGTGHAVCFLDVVPPVSPGQPALTRPGSFIITAEPRCTWEGVFAGTHTFAVELVNGDNTPLNPPVLDAVDVTVVPPGLIR